jgi:hypothetical protein
MIVIAVGRTSVVLIVVPGPAPHHAPVARQSQVREPQTRAKVYSYFLCLDQEAGLFLVWSFGLLRYRSQAGQ